MKKQIKRFSPHQTAKVFAVFMAIATLPMMIPMMLVAMFAPQPMDPHGNPVNFPYVAFLLFPVFYLVFGYISVAIGCWLYNFMYRYVGGVEVEIEDKA